MLWSLQKLTESLLNKSMNVSVLASSVWSFAMGRGGVVWEGKKWNFATREKKSKQTKKNQKKTPTNQLSVMDFWIFKLHIWWSGTGETQSGKKNSMHAFQEAITSGKVQKG